MKKIILLTIFAITLLISTPAHAEDGTMVINNIEMTNFMPAGTLSAADDMYPVNVVENYAIDFAPEASLFSIIILQPPYDEDKKVAEQSFINKLNITKNEACFLNVQISAPDFVLQGEPEETSLSFCALSKRADINGDSAVNTFDFAICLDELTSPPANLKMQCDFNVNRRIDATDLSSVISFLEKP